MHTVVFVVAPDRRELHEALTQAFRDDVHVNVVLDQRVGPRRCASAPAPAREQRRYDRREHHLTDVELRERGWAMVQILS